MTQTGEAEAVRRHGKSAAAFRTTGEVAEELDLPAHVLRFWESKFPQIKPLKRGGGRRYYRPEDIDLLRRIQRCLYQEGYTIRGVQKLLREGALPGEEVGSAPAEDDSPASLSALGAASRSPEPPTGQPASLPALQTALEELRHELMAICRLLDGLIRR